MIEVLQAVLRPRTDFAPAAFAPFVRYGLARSDPGIKRRAESLVGFSGALDYLLEWVEQAQGSDPNLAIPAARNLWRQLAECGPIDARRLRHGAGSRVLSVPDPLPDIEQEIRFWPGPEHRFTSRAPMHPDKARHLREQVQQASHFPCWVCACGQTLLIFNEWEGDLTYKWSIEEVRCDDCGAYTLYLTDD